MLLAQRPRNLFEFLARTEHGYTVCANRDNLSCFGIARTVSALPSPDFKRAESSQFNDFVVAQTGFNLFKKLIHNIVYVFPIYPEFFVDFFDYFRFGQFVSCQNLTFHFSDMDPRIPKLLWAPANSTFYEDVISCD